MVSKSFFDIRIAYDNDVVIKAKKKKLPEIEEIFEDFKLKFKGKNGK